MDPVTMAAMAQAAGSVAQGLGAALADPPVQQGGPSTAFLDGSGWTVATGGSNASARRNDASAMPMADMGSIDPTWVMVAGGVLLVAVLIKRMAAK